jgi:hypothetical protein
MLMESRTAASMPPVSQNTSPRTGAAATEMLPQPSARVETAGSGCGAILRNLRKAQNSMGIWSCGYVDGAKNHDSIA